MTSRFADWSRAQARKLEGWYLKGLNMESAYRDEIRRRVQRNSLILDAGAGKRSFYAEDGMSVVGADAFVEEIAQNRDVRFAVAANLSTGFPFRMESFDAITACYFIEHIADTERFIRSAATVLKPGGWIFLLFPCRYAPFAILNRIIPNRWTVRLLRGLVKQEQGGFPATYSKCWPGGMKRVLEENEFRVVRQQSCHYQAFYCSFFLPLYLLSLAYDLVTRATRIDALASSILIVAQKADARRVLEQPSSLDSQMIPNSVDSECAA